MSNDLLSQFCVESGVTIFFSFRKPFNWISEVWMDGTQVRPVVADSYHSQRLPVIDLYWLLCAASTVWLYWFIQFTTDTTGSVTDKHETRPELQWPLLLSCFLSLQKYLCQWRTFAFLTVSKVLFIYIRLTVMITSGIDTVYIWKIVFLCVKCISICCRVDVTCMGSLLGYHRLVECFFSSIFSTFLFAPWRTEESS